MKQEIKELWVKWLESGEYSMGKHYLYDWSDDTYCPLGVLVELALDDGVELDVVKSDFPNKTKIEGNAKIAPHKVNTWAGLTYQQVNDVAMYNDRHGLERAIKYIKENL